MASALLQSKGFELKD